MYEIEELRDCMDKH